MPRTKRRRSPSPGQTKQPIDGDVEILIRNVRLFGYAGRHDVAIRNERIWKTGRNLAVDAKLVIDGEDQLLTPGLVDAHNHLDKGMLTDASNVRVANLAEMIDIMRGLKRKETVESTYDRILRGAYEGVVRGVTAMRTNVEADPFFKYKAVTAAIKAQKALRPVLDLETIAFPQDGWFKTRGTITCAGSQ